MDYSSLYTSLFNLRQELKSHGVSIDDTTPIAEFDDMVKDIANQGSSGPTVKDLDWLKGIFNNAAAIEGRTKYAICSVLDKGYKSTFSFVSGDTIITSDGSTYTIEDGVDPEDTIPFDHTWDLTKDLTSPDGYRCRWIMFYHKPDYMNNINCALGSYPLLSMYVGAGTLSQVYFTIEGQGTCRSTLLNVEFGPDVVISEDANPSFADLYSLQTLKFNGVLTYFGQGMLANCKCENIDFGDITALYIGYRAFEDTLISNIVIPTGCVNISDHAFHSKHIRSVYIPKTVTEISPNLFTSSETNIDIVSIQVEEGFEANLDLTYCTGLSLQSLKDIVTRMKDFSTEEFGPSLVVPTAYKTELNPLIQAKGWGSSPPPSA